MSDRVYLEGMTLDELLSTVQECVDEATGPLGEEVAALRQELMKSSRRVVSHRAAPLYFDGSITPERVLDYIHGRRLPEGAPGPLPAFKNGNTWFIEVADIENWQVGS